MSAGDTGQLGWDRGVELEAVVTGIGIGGPLGWRRIGFQSSCAGEGDPPGWNGGKITTSGSMSTVLETGVTATRIGDPGHWRPGPQVPGSMGTGLDMRVTAAGIQGPRAGGKSPCPRFGVAGLEKTGRVVQ